MTHKSAYIVTKRPDARYYGWVPVYSIEQMSAFLLGQISPDPWAQFCVSNNVIFHWEGSKGWVKCGGTILKIEGVEFREPVVCKERDE